MKKGATTCPLPFTIAKAKINTIFTIAKISVLDFMIIAKNLPENRSTKKRSRGSSISDDPTTPFFQAVSEEAFLAYILRSGSSSVKRLPVSAVLMHLSMTSLEPMMITSFFARVIAV